MSLLVLGNRYLHLNSGLVNRSAVSFFELGRYGKDPVFDSESLSSISKFSHVIPSTSFCTRQAWLGLPFFIRADQRWEEEDPDFLAVPSPAKMLYARLTIKRLILNESTQDADSSKPSDFKVDDFCPSECNSSNSLLKLVFQLSIWERDLYWPTTRWKEGTMI